MLAFIFGSMSLNADSLAGSIAGVVRDQAKSPVAGTAITLTKLDDNSTKATVSAADVGRGFCHGAGRILTIDRPGLAIQNLLWRRFGLVKDRRRRPTLLWYPQRPRRPRMFRRDLGSASRKPIGMTGIRRPLLPLCLRCPVPNLRTGAILPPLRIRLTRFRCGQWGAPYGSDTTTQLNIR